jgi:putative membrane protein
METPPDLKSLTSNQLSEVRTELAGERTLMSWIRTSLGLISFGFSFHKAMHALSPTHDQSPRLFGIAISAMGTLALVAGTIQYAHVLRSMGDRRPGFTFYFACLGIGLGVLVIGGIALRFGPFA